MHTATVYTVLTFFNATNKPHYIISVYINYSIFLRLTVYHYRCIASATEFTCIFPLTRNYYFSAIIYISIISILENEVRIDLC